MGIIKEFFPFRLQRFRKIFGSDPVSAGTRKKSEKVPVLQNETVFSNIF